MQEKLLNYYPLNSIRFENEYKSRKIMAFPEPEYLEIKFLLESEVEECPVVTAVIVLPVLPVLRPEVNLTHVLGFLPNNVSSSKTF